MTITVLRSDAAHLPIADNTVDLVVTSPPYFALRSYTDGCATCAETSRARNRGYMERYCPSCQRVFTSGRNKCHICNVTTLTTDATKAAQKSTSCPDCKGTGKGHYPGQLGAEATPAEFVDALLAVTRECMRVLKPSGSLWVNLGDKYSGGSGGQSNLAELGRRLGTGGGHSDAKAKVRSSAVPDMRPKTLIGIPWRYALRCIDDLGLILRAEVIWNKPNGLPESVTDRVRRSHEQWFHFTLQPRYYSAVDEIREAHLHPLKGGGEAYGRHDRGMDGFARHSEQTPHPLGKLPGSVWTVATEPLQVPERLGVDHFAAFPTEWPRRIITGWSPRDVCQSCGEGRRPVSAVSRDGDCTIRRSSDRGFGIAQGDNRNAGTFTITGYTCACTHCDCGAPLVTQTDGQPGCGNNVHHVGPPTRPGVVLDPFGGTGTTAHVAHALGRHGINVDLSADYNRLAADPEMQANRWRKIHDIPKPVAETIGQADLFAEGAL